MNETFGSLICALCLGQVYAVFDQQATRIRQKYTCLTNQLLEMFSLMKEVIPGPKSLHSAVYISQMLKTVKILLFFFFNFIFLLRKSIMKIFLIK